MAGWSPIFTAEGCQAQRGSVRYDENGQPYVFSGHCDYSCGFCEHPCAVQSEITNLPELIRGGATMFLNVLHVVRNSDACNVAHTLGR